METKRLKSSAPFSPRTNTNSRGYKIFSEGKRRGKNTWMKCCGKWQQQRVFLQPVAFSPRLPPAVTSLLDQAWREKAQQSQQSKLSPRLWKGTEQFGDHKSRKGAGLQAVCTCALTLVCRLLHTNLWAAEDQRDLLRPLSQAQAQHHHCFLHPPWHLSYHNKITSPTCLRMQLLPFPAPSAHVAPLKPPPSDQLPLLAPASPSGRRPASAATKSHFSLQS